MGLETQLDLFNVSPSFNKQSKGIVCRHCNTLKPRDHFRLYRRATGDDRDCRSTSCKECQKEHNDVVKSIRKTAPHPPDECQCCGKKTTKLVLDHCHETKTFRGWLCSACNLAIGSLGDSAERVEQALNYLMKSKKT